MPRTGRPPVPAVLRIERRVRIEDNDCWVYLGALSPSGYGMVAAYKLDGKYARGRRAHIVMYEYRHGAVPPGLELDHLCRNRACVNPDHLEPVTHAENMRRRRSETCTKGHPMDYVDPRGRRSCRTCQREYHRLFRERNGR